MIRKVFDLLWFMIKRKFKKNMKETNKKNDGFKIWVDYYFDGKTPVKILEAQRRDNDN